MDLRGKLEAFVAGVRIRFRLLGQGPPLLIMPGMLGCDAQAAAEASSGVHTVFAPDPPGFWQSEAPKERLTLPWLGGWTGVFHREVIGEQPIAALGFSAGATLLVHYATTYPGATRRLVLYEPIIRGQDLPKLLQLLIRASIIPGATAAMLKAAPILTPLIEGIRGVEWGKRPRVVAGVNSPRAAGEFARSLLGTDVREALRYLDVPVLIIRGDRGGLIPTKGLAALRGSQINHLEMPGLGHFLNRQSQQVVVEAARDFFRPSRVF